MFDFLFSLPNNQGNERGRNYPKGYGTNESSKDAIANLIGFYSLQIREFI